jgi:hypothetical protein
VPNVYTDIDVSDEVLAALDELYRLRNRRRRYPDRLTARPARPM